MRCPRRAATALAWFAVAATGAASMTGCVTEEPDPLARWSTPVPAPAPWAPPAAKAPQQPPRQAQPPQPQAPQGLSPDDPRLAPSPIQVKTDKPAPPGPVPPVGLNSSALDVGTDDAAMNAAVAKARGSLDTFLALAAAPPPDASRFRVSVEFRDGAAVEYLWVAPFRRVGDDFEGIVANRPATLHNIMLGERVRFSRDQIADWGYQQKGRQIGSFTVCVLMARMSPAEDAFLREQGFDCRG